MNESEVEIIGFDTLIERCGGLRKDNCRLVQVSCTQTGEKMELTYSFEKDGNLVNLRIYWAPGESVPSIQSVYSCAFIYENEISELFGVAFSGMAVDFSGKLYKTAMETPFATSISIQGV